MPTTFGAELTHWSFEPSVVLGLLVVCAAYLWTQTRPSLRTSAGARWSFAAGMAVLAVALVSPLDDLSDRYLLTAHMVQHLMLVLLAAPLLARAMPSDWAARIRVHPIIAFAMFNVVFTFSHVQVWYEATLIHEPLHVIEHLAYLLTGIVNWLPVLTPAPERRLSYPLRMLYLFLETLPMFVVGALLSLSESVLYPFYLRAPRILPVTPLEDQSTAGLLMWIGGSFFYLGALTLVFFKWANREIGLEEPIVEESWQETRLTA
ncbi:MAG: cytochrome c oxidase assembly protein [Chloroflexi bacterium]|nr:cytochrome c oxidase assembly protein [Chloroflexota bacterium]